MKRFAVLVLDQCEAARLHDNTVGLRIVLALSRCGFEEWHICPGATKQGHSPSRPRSCLAHPPLSIIPTSITINTALTPFLSNPFHKPQAVRSTTTTTAMVVISSKRPPVRS